MKTPIVLINPPVEKVVEEYDVLAVLVGSIGD